MAVHLSERPYSFLAMVLRLSPVCTLYCLVASIAASALGTGTSRTAMAGAITSIFSGRVMVVPALRRWGSTPGLARWMWAKYAPLPYSALAMVQKLSPFLTVYLRGPVDAGGSMSRGRLGMIVVGGSWGVMTLGPS